MISNSCLFQLGNSALTCPLSNEDLKRISVAWECKTFEDETKISAVDSLIKIFSLDVNWLINLLSEECHLDHAVGFSWFNTQSIETLLS